MNIDWQFIKQLLYILGPLGALFAIYRKVIESKFNRDIEKINHVKSLVSEPALISLESEVYQVRRVPEKQFSPFDQISHEIRTNQETTRFSGPSAKYLTNELASLIEAYTNLRKYIQVDEWLPRTHACEDGSILEVWEFNKNATIFTKKTGYPSDYGTHLDEAAEQAMNMKKAFNRFQVVSELHLFETPIACWLLKKRFKKLNLSK